LVVQETIAEDWVIPKLVIPERVGAVVSGRVTVLLTLTVMLVVAVLLAAALATTVMVWLPLLKRVVFQATEYGEVVSTVGVDESIWKETEATPTLSVAVAEMVTEDPETVEAEVGAVMETVGLVVSGVGALVVKVLSKDVARLPAESLDLTL